MNYAPYYARCSSPIMLLRCYTNWLIIGLLIAALISVSVTNDFFADKIPNDFIGMLLILIISIPVYICATGYVPVAAGLMLKGLSPGAALVLLMAGPATIAKPTLKTVLNLQKAWKWQLLT